MASTLLEQAIVDAKALKEAAMKKAESAVIERYSHQIKEAIETILQREAINDEEEDTLDPTQNIAPEDIGLQSAAGGEDPMAGGDEMGGGMGSLNGAPEDELALPDSMGQEEPGLEGEMTPEDPLTNQMPSAMSAGEDEIEIDLDQLSGLVDKEMSSLQAGLGNENENLSNTISQLAATITDLKDTVEDMKAGSPVNDADATNGAIDDLEQEEPLREEEISTEMPEEPEGEVEDDGIDLASAIRNYMASQQQKKETPGAIRTADIGVDKVQPHQYPRNINGREDDVERRKTLQALSEKNEKLNEELTKYKRAMKLIVEKVEEINLQNAVLLYKNRTLESISLNERQKKQIVEALSRAGSIKEAKVIYDTLLSANGGSRARDIPAPKSLREVKSRHASLVVNGEKDTKSVEDDVYQRRMRKLAGIDKN